MESQFNELVTFVVEQMGIHTLTITRNTKIEDDLGITGDDAEDLIIALSKKYNINVQNFNFAKYFNDEPGVFHYPREIEALTIGHLEKAILAGKLDDDVIASINL